MRIVVASQIRALCDAIQRSLSDHGHKGAIEPIQLHELPDALLCEPDLLLVAASLADSAHLVRDIRVSHPVMPVAAMALNDGDDEFIAWAAFGICGYIEPAASADDIAATLLRIVAGEIVFPQRLSSLLLRQFSRQHERGEVAQALSSLTRRETEVVVLVADGLSNKQIARRLRITDATAKNHVHSILEKFDVGSRGVAAARYRQAVTLAPLARGHHMSGDRSGLST